MNPVVTQVPEITPVSCSNASQSLFSLSSIHCRTPSWPW